MTTYPAFEEALRTGDHSALLSLYATALAQRDRAEAIIRALLNPATSTQTIAKETQTHTDCDKPYVNCERVPQYPTNMPPEPPPRKALKKAPAPKPNLADSI